jgi:ribulose-phosphate 3-epimerase
MILAASILSADFGRLAEEVARAELAGAHQIHVDVMDGRFVPNITVGPGVVKALRKATHLPLDVHLMVDEGDRYVDAFAEAGADWITLHVEAVRHIERAVARIAEWGRLPGLALNPATSLSTLDEILPALHHVLLMTVNPGFGGQKLIPSTIEKVRRLSKVIEANGLPTLIEVDGGVTPDTAPALTAAGARVLVAGNAVFGQPDMKHAIDRLLSPVR